MPVHVEAEEPIRSSTQNIFFGFVKLNQTVTKTFTLSAEKSFRILKIESDNSMVQLQSDILKMKASMEHSIEVEFSPTQQGQVYSGEIYITTDMPTQEVMRLNYSARVQ